MVRGMSRRLPTATIAELLRSGGSTAAVRCLRVPCLGEAVVLLGSIDPSLRSSAVAWACAHCGGTRVIVEVPQRRHSRYRAMTLEEMRQAARESASAHIPCRPRQVVIEDAPEAMPVMSPRTDGAFEGLDRILAGP